MATEVFIKTALAMQDYFDFWLSINSDTSAVGTELIHIFDDAASSTKFLGLEVLSRKIKDVQLSEVLSTFLPDPDFFFTDKVVFHQIARCDFTLVTNRVEGIRGFGDIIIARDFQGPPFMSFMTDAMKTYYARQEYCVSRREVNLLSFFCNRYEITREPVIAISREDVGISVYLEEFYSSISFRFRFRLEADLLRFLNGFYLYGKV